MTALSEEEIRAELAKAWHRRPRVGYAPDVEWDWGFNNGFLAMSSAPWDIEDMRDSEIERLDELVETALAPIREDVERRAIDALVGAMQQFSQEHPDTPRRRELTPA